MTFIRIGVCCGRVSFIIHGKFGFPTWSFVGGGMSRAILSNARLEPLATQGAKDFGLIASSSVQADD
jgi:hypothetical protein